VPDVKKRVEPTAEHFALAQYVFDWLAERNGRELHDALYCMTLQSHAIAMQELAAILANGGKPPNWV
jgi:hypothetical protein